MRFIAPRKRFLLLFTLALATLLTLIACNAAPAGQVDAQGRIIDQAKVESIAVTVSGETPPFDIVVTANGALPDACTQPGDAQISRLDDHFLITLNTQRPANERCKKTSQPFTKTVSLDGLGLPKGDYAVSVNGVTGTFTLAQDNVPPTPTPTPTPIPPVLLPAIEAPTPTATPQGHSRQDAKSCTNRVTFIADVTIPDNAQMAANVKLTKTWRLKNTGTCTWSAEYALVFAGGNQMKAPDSQMLGVSVRPGKTVDISLDLTAPGQAGAYTSEWLLQTPAGEKFGLGDDGKTPFWLKIRVP